MNVTARYIREKRGGGSTGETFSSMGGEGAKSGSGEGVDNCHEYKVKKSLRT